MIKLAVLILFLMLLVVSCGPAKFRVETATARDTIFSVEHSFNGSTAVFLTHDESVLYCTSDRDLGEKAQTLLEEHDGEVLVKFRFIRRGDSEHSWWNSSDCDNYYSFASVLLVDLIPVDSRGNKGK